MSAKQLWLSDEVKRIRKQPANLICADCPVRSTPYVCIDYSSFVCTGCAGIHRALNHRIKSIAVATFNEKEVESLRNGGNAVLNRIYLAKYDRNTDPFTLPLEGETDKIKRYMHLKYTLYEWFEDDTQSTSMAVIRERKKKKKKSVDFGDFGDFGNFDNFGDDPFGDIVQQSNSSTELTVKLNAAQSVNAELRVMNESLQSELKRMKRATALHREQQTQSIQKINILEVTVYFVV